MLIIYSNHDKHVSEIKFECAECESSVRLVLPIIELGGSKKSITCTNCNQLYVFEMSIWMELSKPKYKDRKWLHRQYVIEEKSMSEIAKICGKSAMTIRDWLIRHEIPRRGTGQRSS